MENVCLRNVRGSGLPNSGARNSRPRQALLQFQSRSNRSSFRRPGQVATIGLWIIIKVIESKRFIGKSRNPFPTDLHGGRLGNEIAILCIFSLLRSNFIQWILRCRRSAWSCVLHTYIHLSIHIRPAERYWEKLRKPRLSGSLRICEQFSSMSRFSSRERREKVTGKM